MTCLIDVSLRAPASATLCPSNHWAHSGCTFFTAGQLRHSAKITALILCNRRVWNLPGQVHRDVGAGSWHRHIIQYVSSDAGALVAIQCRASNQSNSRGSGFNYAARAGQIDGPRRRLSPVITGSLITLWFSPLHSPFSRSRLHTHHAALRPAVQRHLAFGLSAQGKWIGSDRISVLMQCCNGSTITRPFVVLIAGGLISQESERISIPFSSDCLTCTQSQSHRPWDLICEIRDRRFPCLWMHDIVSQVLSHCFGATITIILA